MAGLGKLQVELKMVVNAKTGCVVAIHCSDYLTDDQKKLIENQAKDALPFCGKVVVLDKGITLTIINPPDDSGNATNLYKHIGDR